MSRFVDLYWSKVDVRAEDECWPWCRATYWDGYGCVGIRRPSGRSTTMRAHVLSLILSSGEDANGRLALHSCDNPPCCNPRHLRWGTQKDNVADMDARGRARRPILRGEQSPRAKLTQQLAGEIRCRYGAGGVSQQALADEYGVSQFAVSQVILGRRWAA